MTLLGVQSDLCGEVTIYRCNNATHSVVKEVRDIVHLYVIGPLCVLGLIANIFAYVVLRYDRQRREALLLLQALAAADSLYLLTALLRYPIRNLLDARHGEAMQPYVLACLKVAQTATIWMVVIVTAERFVYVCKPLQAQRVLTRRMKRGLIISVFVFALTFNLPRFFDSCVITFINRCNNIIQSVTPYRPSFNNAIYFDVYLSAMYICFLYIIPLAIIVYVNIRLIFAILHSRRRQREYMLEGRNSREQSENNATFVLIIIVVVFVVCETPELVNQISSAIVRRIHTPTESFPALFVHMSIVSEVLMIINSSINFFIYFCFGRRFRSLLKELCKTKFKSNSTQMTIIHEAIPAPLNVNQAALVMR